MTANIVDSNSPILITGANGFIGSSVVEILLERGYSNLRCFVRPSGKLDHLNQVLEAHPNANVQILTGNLLSRMDCDQAVRGVSVIYHLAAGIDKSFAGAFMNSVLTTRNLLDAAV